MFSRKATTIHVVGGNPDWPIHAPGPRDRFQGYEYAWPHPHPPQTGTWVVLPGDNGEWLGGVVRTTQTTKAKASGLKRALRVATDEDLAAERARRTR